MKEQPKETNNRGMGFPSEKNKPSNLGINYLLSIAIDDYQNFPKLYNCVKDASEIVDILTSRYQFDKKHVYTLYNEEATTDKIFKKFEVLAEKIRPIDNLIIYFAGHGEYKKVFKEGYWIPVNATSNRTSQFIPNSEIKTMLSAINTKHTFLIADSCFSGSLFARGSTRSIAERVERFPSRWGLTSGRSEIVADGAPGINSPFASSILFLLKNNQKQLGVQQLCAYVIESVISTAIQTPIGEPLTIPGHKGGQFVFRLKEGLVEPINNTVTNNTSEELATSTFASGAAVYEHDTTPGQTTAFPKWLAWAVPLAIIGIYLLTFLIPETNPTPISDKKDPITLEDKKDKTLEENDPKIIVEKEEKLKEEIKLKSPNNNPLTNPPKKEVKEKQTTPEPAVKEKPKFEYQPKEPVEKKTIINPPPVKKEEPVYVPPPRVEPKIPAPILNLKNSMVRIKRGKFVMGSETKNDAPLHVVQISRGYYISKTEVTQELWKAVMGNNPSIHKNCNQCPVENISYYEVEEFLEKINKITGQKFRLPSEAEWEYAAVAGKINDLTYQDPSNLNRIAYYKGNTQSSKPVSGKSPNKIGLHDMLGNVSEWCLDWYAEDFYKDNARNPLNRNKGLAASKIIRGGSFMSSEEKCSVYHRAAMSPNQRKGFIGFRLVRD